MCHNDTMTHVAKCEVERRGAETDERKEGKKEEILEEREKERRDL
jgi:hypothetical protein